MNSETTYKTPLSQREATARYRAKNIDILKPINAEKERFKYHNDEQYRQKALEKSRRQYQRKKEMKLKTQLESRLDQFLIIS